MSVTIRLQNLPLSANAANIREFFHGLQIPDGGVNIVGGEEGDAFIVFATDDDARRAMLLNNQPINGVMIKLFLSSKIEMQNVIKDAQNRVSNYPKVANNGLGHSLISSEKRSYSYFEPNVVEAPPNKLRIIDYAAKIDYYDNNIEPPKPSEFNYKFSKYSKPIDNQRNINDFDQYNNTNYNDGRNCRNDYYSNSYIEEKSEFYDIKYYNKSHEISPHRDVIDQHSSIHGYRDQRNNQSYDKYSNSRDRFENRPSAPFVIRIILPNHMNKNRTVFDIFHGLKIVSKVGIKIEMDSEKRFTGYVFIHFANEIDANKALRMNNTNYHGYNLTIEQFPIEDFHLVSNIGEIVRIDKNTRLNELSPYYRDLCAEIHVIPSGLSVDELNSHFNNILDLKQINFVEFKGRFCCVLRLDKDESFIQVLSMDGTFLNKVRLKITAISYNQYQNILVVTKKEQKNYEVRSYIGIPKVPLKINESTKQESVKTNLTCLKVDDLPKNFTKEDLSTVFKPVTLEKSDVMLHENEAIIDVKNSETCQKILDFVKANKLEFTVKPITSTAYNSLKNIFTSKKPSKSVAESKQQPNLNENSINNQSESNSIKTTNNRHSTNQINSFYVKIKNLPEFIGNSQLSNFIRKFRPQPANIELCYTNNSKQHNGEAILTFRELNHTELFIKEFNGINFKQKTLEVYLSDSK